jgi:hypothetical protein
VVTFADNQELKDIIIVSGLPRSGTSAMMQCLEAGGVPIATDNIRKSDEDNPRGYFELEAVKLLRGSPGKVNLRELRGQAVKMAHPLLYWLPLGYSYRVLVMRRDLEEVVASQNIMLKRRGKTITETEQLLSTLFERELDRLVGWLGLRTNFFFMCINYRDLVLNPGKIASVVNAFLGGGYDTVRMSKAIDCSLYHCRVMRSTGSPDQ